MSGRVDTPRPSTPAGNPSASSAIAGEAALIGLDWGTSSLRAYLFDRHGRTLAERALGYGIMRLPPSTAQTADDADGGAPAVADRTDASRTDADKTAFDRALDLACGDWRDAAPTLPMLACGMVGSAQGWREVPYVERPAGAAQLAAGLGRVTTARGTPLHIVPGVIRRGALPNVMRGEETQVIGALHPDDATVRLIGLPGTHAKWALVRAARIDDFATFMTGEVFHALSTHTILGRTMTTPAVPDTTAFLRGVDVAREQSDAGMLSTIFTSRTLGLTGELRADQQPDYLSGLLIGHELAGLAAVLRANDANDVAHLGLAAARPGRVPATALAGLAPTLIGDAALCTRYRLALSRFGCDAVGLAPHAAPHGLWRIATAAGLVPEAAPLTSIGSPA
ncbi:2-dehydro-3-deoxygalactonokinase [Robbsia sp. Bb-Pol-6]|uniref:2-dehydro-3-deoxygalactonokinase n=1 Tax=Robbsia betulipollinis TaxID=2981849 RepID=A0ABT3ZSB8_9BURK|nr:2-dehydro-3-deoxygalactonokinase [Robbsia betulipollinis]MCY0389441.1 2-dehydro-3-deoxygalactonokinase [Robbsia betulipollinis]